MILRICLLLKVLPYENLLLKKAIIKRNENSLLNLKITVFRTVVYICILYKSINFIMIFDLQGTLVIFHHLEVIITLV